MPGDSKGFDLIGIGKIAEAIPDEVYIHTTDAIIDKFDRSLSPLMELSSGIGRIIKQKFDNLVDAEKALAAYTIQNVITKANKKASKLNKQLSIPVHEKSFVRSFEEASKERDPILHVMWENLLSDQLINNNFHPNFVNILSSISPEEAHILLQLRLRNEIGENDGEFFIFTDDSFKNWITYAGDQVLRRWDYPCVLLYQYRLVDLLAPKKETYKKEDCVVIIYKTPSGEQFLEAVK